MGLIRASQSLGPTDPIWSKCLGDEPGSRDGRGARPKGRFDRGCARSRRPISSLPLEARKPRGQGRDHPARGSSELTSRADHCLSADLYEAPHMVESDLFDSHRCICCGRALAVGGVLETVPLLVPVIHRTAACSTCGTTGRLVFVAWSARYFPDTRVSECQFRPGECISGPASSSWS